jgi:hypothetical protein
MKSNSTAHDKFQIQTFTGCIVIYQRMIIYCTFSIEYFGTDMVYYISTWWTLFQKRVVRTNFDIYVFIEVVYKLTISSSINTDSIRCLICFISGSIPLLVASYSLEQCILLEIKYIFKHHRILRQQYSSTRKRSTLVVIIFTLFRNCKFQWKIYLKIYVSAETVTTGRMIANGNKRPPTEVSTRK